MTLLHPDRLFPVDPASRTLARALFDTVKDAPIVSPHGHTDPSWFAENAPFGDPASLLITPDHYLTRMLTSQGVPFEALGIGPGAEQDPRRIWLTFAAHYYLFAGTPSRLWVDQALADVFGVTDRLSPETADAAFDRIADKLTQPEFTPRALYDRFNLSVLATTDGALDDLRWHQQIAQSDWTGRVIPTYRPDAVIDPDAPGFTENLDRLGDITVCDTATWQGYLDAHRARRAYFKSMGATATDHGHPTPRTADLPQDVAAALFDRIRRDKPQPGDAELFRAQMLTEMARMSVEDGLVLQIHSGSSRSHSDHVRKTFGTDRGFDIPVPVSFTDALRPLLNTVGLEPNLTVVLYTLDETTYARELAPLAGVWPCLLLGPPWWFHDSYEGMRRFRQSVTETAGFWNLAGFNDDTRALCSIPARHDVARRVDSAFLAELVTSHRLDESEAFDLAPRLAGDFAKRAFRLN